MKTIAELQASEKILLTPQEVGPLLNMHPQTINLMAKRGELPFKAFRSGYRTKIPRIPLLEYLTTQ